MPGANRRSKRLRNPSALEQLRAIMHEKKAVMEAMRAAHFLGTPFREEVPDYESVRVAAQEFIHANYEYQKAAYGRVRVKLSVANLMR
jgi:hypothetical protein